MISSSNAFKLATLRHYTVLILVINIYLLLDHDYFPVPRIKTSVHSTEY